MEMECHADTRFQINGMISVTLSLNPNAPSVNKQQCAAWRSFPSSIPYLNSGGMSGVPSLVSALLHLSSGTISALSFLPPVLAPALRSGNVIPVGSSFLANLPAPQVVM